VELVVLKTLALFLLVLILALGIGSCARPRGLIPAVVQPEEQPLCDIPHLQEELASCEERLAADDDRDGCLIRLARVSFILGEMSPKNEGSRYYEKGRRYSQILIQEQPSRPEGHYWLALNLGGLAQQGGARRGLKVVPEIVAAVEKALKENPAYDQAGPHRVLGRIYFECPAWPLSVGNLPESLKHLSAAVAIAPENSTNHLFLAETLFKLGKTQEAREQLQEVLAATYHSLCPQFLQEDRHTAQDLLKQ
jgi:tetratricopeptide (TPR) repeat protein